AEPDLAPLPPEDRGPVARALAKDPAQRFGSCLDFMRALLAVSDPSALADPASSGTRLRVAPTRGAGPRSGSGAPEQEAQFPTPYPQSLTPAAGLQLLERLEDGPLGGSWKARTPDGRARLAHVLPLPVEGAAEAAERFAARLQDLHHRALPALELTHDVGG